MKAPDSKKPTVGAVGFETTGALASTEKAANQNGVCVINFEETSTASQESDRIADELRKSFSLVAQPANGAAVRGKDFLLGVADLFSAGRVKVAVSCYVGAGINAPSHIEVAGKLPRAALKILRRVRGETQATLCWRQGHSGDAPLYALQDLGQLADLLAAAGEVRR
ncbi:hypothetical protein [Azotobacter beijerinckii]|uniref:hypothetical protein n=1 Tax=Azotobacter beijerinckii TaxID=170623 RepID=UPI002954D29B|nr:hypothetical protein [Azotobacter beijerinckii]MDV7210784.1 hypothetical protein [Azotobacter beijerinckii]